jgi:putative pyruvate formate lyase activating enzyme
MVDIEALYAYMIRPDSKLVWENEEVKERLSWYYKVMKNELPAKYLIVKRTPIPQDTNLDDISVESLWDVHKSCSREFKKIWSEIRNGSSLDSYPQPNSSFLDVKIKLVDIILRECIFCEHLCKVDRAAGKRGRCGLDEVSRVSTAFLHMGEEAPLVPSGTIFFTGCSFKCVFCQNFDISVNPFSGVEVSPKELANLAISLRKRGARNINYVGGNPDQHLHNIVKSLRYMNINVPLLWNSNFYFSMESLLILADLIDIWLPDFKYGNDDCAFKLSRIKNYFRVSSRNHKLLHDMGENIIIRHLVLPNHLDCCTKPILRWISDNTPNVLVNVMDQYRPEHRVAREPERFPDVARRLTRREINEAYGEAERLGLIYKPVS